MDNFFDFLSSVGFDKTQTRIEKYRIDGTSNYLVSLNYSGVTWAVALRLPAMGKDATLFEQEKLNAVNTAEYLVELFESGIPVSNNVVFCFRGNSALVSYDSVQEFFEYQNHLQPLIEIENVTGLNKQKIVAAQVYPDGVDNIKNVDTNKKDKVKQYLSEYRGAFFASKGAPASETLDDYFDLVFEIAKALSLLHKKSGLKTLLPIQQVYDLVTQLISQLEDLAKETDFKEGTAVYESYLKHQKKRNPHNDERISLLIKKELLLRTNLGKNLLGELLNKYEVNLTDLLPYKCFTHNDPHCENFVIVKHLYRVINNNHPYMDREFINEIIAVLNNGQLGPKYSIEYKQDSNTLCMRNYIAGDENNTNVNVIEPNLYYDIHLIDIDEATGVDEESRKLYLYDLLVFALSAQNMSAIKGGDISANDIIDEYYKYWSTIK